MVCLHQSYHLCVSPSCDMLRHSKMRHAHTKNPMRWRIIYLGSPKTHKCFGKSLRCSTTMSLRSIFCSGPCH